MLSTKRLLIALLLITPLMLHALSQDDVKQLERYSVRPEGSTNERLTAQFIEQFALKLNIEHNLYSLDNLEQFHSFSRSIELAIPGRTSDEIVYAMPLNNNNSSLVALLMLAEQLAEQPAEVGARFLFLGGEKGEGVYYPLGLNDFLYNYASSGNNVIFYFDFEKTGDQFTVSSYGKNISSLATIKLALKNSSNQYFSSRFKANSSQSIHPNSHLFRSEHSTRQSTNIALFTIETDYPTVMPLWQWSKNFANLFFTSHHTTLKIDDNNDLNYLYLSPFFISEPLYVFIYILLLLLFLSILFNHYSAINRQLRHLGSFFWQYFLLFILLFTFLFTSSLTLQNVAFIKNDPNFWRYIPLPFAVFKFTLAFFLTTYSFRMIKSLGVLLSPKNYATAAIFFASINLIFYTIWQLNYSAPWLWFVFFAFLFFYTKQIKLSHSFALIAVTPLALFFINFFVEPNYQFIEFLLFSSFLGNLFLATMLFPLLLMALSIYHAQHLSNIKRHQWLSLVVLFSASLLSAQVIFFYRPYSFLSYEKQPVFLNHVEDLNLDIASVQLLSPVYMNDVNLYIDDEFYPLAKLERSVEIRLPTKSSFIVTSKTTPLLSRNKIDIEILMDTAPSRIELLLIADKSIGVIDANYPISLTNQLRRANQATIFIGANPPMPLKIALVTERDINFQIEVTAYFDHDNTTIDSKFDLHKKHSVTQTFAINN